MMKLLTILIIAAFFSCKTTENNSTVKNISKKEIEEIIHIAAEIKSGTNGAFVQKENTIITNNEDFRKVWVKVFANYSNKEAFPEIDFEKKTLILVTMGEQRSGGYSIKIGIISENSKTVNVNIIEGKPGPNCMNASVMTYPFHIVEIERGKSNKEFVFNTTEEVYKCD